MTSQKQDERLTAATWPEIVRKVRARTPARLLVGRAGAAYSTITQMELREAHAAARDAVRMELDARSLFGEAFIERWGLFEASTRAANKDEYLLRPDQGRHFNDSARAQIQAQCTKGCDLQIAIGDGLSVPAVGAQVPRLLPLIIQFAMAKGWSVGQVFSIRYCRVGILNQIGELLRPNIALLLIGERPGLATAESLSAYMAYRPKSTDTDANRNLISNIHARGLSVEQAGEQIVNLAERMTVAGTSGCNLAIHGSNAAPPPKALDGL